MNLNSFKPFRPLHGPTASERQMNCLTPGHRLIYCSPRLRPQPVEGRGGRACRFKARKIISGNSLPWPLRLISWVLIWLQLGVPFNTQLFAAVDAPVQSAPPAQVAAANPAFPPHAINRTLPAVQAPSTYPAFSNNPSDQEIFRARVFAEPLLPIGVSSGVENKALAKALLAFLHRASNDDVSALLAFLEEHPQSVWKGSLLLSLGQVYRKTGYFSKALEAWEGGWDLAKGSAGSNTSAISPNRTVAPGANGASPLI